jgi:serine/threonine-protein kinase
MLVMDLVRGESLAERVARVGGRLPAGRVLDIADRTLDVLAAVHARSVVHCDIKPDNVLLVEGGVALLDFGIARAKDFEGLPPLPDAVAREPMGTPDFMPPEQAAGRWEWVDARSDIYALGATLFLLLTGRFVRDGVSVSSQLEAARCHRAPSLCAIAPGLRSVLGDVVDRALAFDPDARHPSARAMQEAVRRAKERYVEGAEEELENRYRQKHASGLYLSARSTLPAGGRIARAS